MAETKSSALDQTRRLLEAQRQEAQSEEHVWRALAVEARDIPILLPIAHVFELAVCENITPVPLTQPWLRGMTNVRGQLYSVVDLSVFLGGRETRLSRDARIVMLADQGLGSCLLVGHIVGLKVLKEEELSAPPDSVVGEIAQYFSGGVALEGRVWAVLDVPSLGRDPRYRQPSRVDHRQRAAGAGPSG